ncbi:HAMP domain-containing sensor histidine kinase [Sphaerisporangium sp. TRM90804]|uniref:sensor histidine kinase n=1 Tax=Sphaerisporangium sp. TRM90804 TaxID=3031113 RepID=UPI00244B5210|nr:HAMP domain-containing sensor histidine kinase [Sphaerisporangium sp. TRM90804]MDH2426263.1 HAMP domain-containing sensor histidine kinase [Sphaerisporangium sp. TRM90804]
MSSERRWSVRTRITFFAGVVAVLLTTLLASILMTAIHRLATEYLIDEVTSAGARVASEIERGLVKNPLPHGEIDYIQVVDAEGLVAASTPALAGREPIARFVPEPGRHMASSVVCGGVLPGGVCHVVVAQRVYYAGQTWMVYSAAPGLPPLVHPRLAALMIGGVLFLTAAVTFGSYRVVTRSLKPVNAIRNELETINATCPDRRVPVPPSEDEIHDLAESVNHTLDRLQSAMEQQRQFASDASHDLRSPITAMRAQVEDALLAPEDTSIDVMGDSLLVSLDRLQAIVCDLLMVARLDAGTPGAEERLDLAEMVGAELNGRQWTRKIVRDLEPRVVVAADRLRLARLFTNLIDNAERHARTTITVVVRAEPPTGDRRFGRGTAVLEVCDDGSGIEPDKREIVFQRFTRLDAARNKDAGGTGLGLAIARQIAQLSGGTLAVEPSDEGARFVLRLPLSPFPAPAAVPPCDDARSA